jgi:hypothetical protein
VQQTLQDAKAGRDSRPACQFFVRQPPLLFQHNRKLQEVRLSGSFAAAGRQGVASLAALTCESWGWRATGCQRLVHGQAHHAVIL